MTARERLIAILLGSFITVGVVGLLAYLLVLSPLAEKSDKIDKLNSKIEEKTAKKEKIDAGRRRLAALRAISLPPEPNTAQREYDYILTTLLTRAGIPAGFRTVNVKLAPDKSTIPFINPSAPNKEKKPAYQKVTADITMARVNIRALMKFLTTYQQLGILQHVSKMTVKMSDIEASNGSTSRRGGGSNDRNNLTVTLTSEAAILDGIEPRESLVRIPRSVAAVGGVAVYQALDMNPDVGRKLALNRPAEDLMSPLNARNYDDVYWKDPFHGKVPPPPTILPPEKVVLPSVAKWIKMTGWTTNSDGSASVDITDKANNIIYEIQLSRRGEKLHTVVTKQRILENRVITFTLNRGANPGADVKSWVNQPFTISDAIGSNAPTSSTHRTFTVHGLVQPFGLIVSSSGDDEKQADEPRGGNFRGGRGGFGGGRGGFPSGRSTATFKHEDLVAVAGGLVSTVKLEKYYVWTVGQSLSDLKEVPKDRVDALLNNALAPLMPDSPKVSPIVSVVGEGR
ncbi:MAG TPA: hypothetical protein VGJ05_14325 [Fimbriiglobus sp.]